MKWYTCGDAIRLELSGTDVAAAARAARHAFLNDLQILGGWLQLGRLGTAVEYLSRVRSRITRESALAALSQPDLEAALTLARVRAESKGLAFSAAVAGVEPVDVEYLTAAAAGRDPSGGAARRLPRAFPVAVLVIVSGIIGRAAESGFSEIEVVVAPSEGRLEIVVRLPGAARGLVGVEEQVLSSGGFTVSGPERPSVVGLEWRGARPAAGRLGSQLVAEDAEAGLELVIVPGRGDPTPV